MCGVALSTDILDLNEAIHLGKLFRDVSLEDFMTLLRQEECSYCCFTKCFCWQRCRFI